jgi:hypothetical protein
MEAATTDTAVRRPGAGERAWRALTGSFTARPGAWAFLLYGAIALVFFGARVADHPGSELVGTEPIEPSQYVWFLEWWPHALLNGLNPFHTELLFAPDGYNLTWAHAGIAGPSLALAPVTLAFGPVVSYNVLAVLCPTVAAWGAFVLCHHVSRAPGPSLAAGYLFGFGAGVLSNLQGVPNLAFVGLLPLCVYVALRHLDGSLSARRYVPALAALLVAQFLTSSELLAMLTLVGAVAAGAAYALAPAARAALRSALPATTAAYAAAGVVLSPWLYWMFFQPREEPLHVDPAKYSADLLSFAFPTGVQRLGRTWFEPLATTFGGEGGGPGGGGRAYLGLPLLLLVVLFAVRRWRTLAAKLLVVVLAVTAVAALGPRLLVAGLRTMPMPWEPFTHLPLLKYAAPVHFTTFTALAVSVAVALWLGARPTRAQWALVAAAVVFLAPNLTSRRWHTPLLHPPFFADGTYKRYIGDRDRVFAVPFVGDNERWQAQAGMPFALTGGYIGEVPPDFARFYARLAASVQQPTPAGARQARRFLDAKGVTVVVVSDEVNENWDRLFDLAAGRAGRDVGGVRVWRLRPAP